MEEHSTNLTPKNKETLMRLRITGILKDTYNLYGLGVYIAGTVESILHSMKEICGEDVFKNN